MFWRVPNSRAYITFVSEALRTWKRPPKLPPKLPRKVSTRGKKLLFRSSFSAVNRCKRSLNEKEEGVSVTLLDISIPKIGTRRLSLFVGWIFLREFLYHDSNRFINMLSISERNELLNHSLSQKGRKSFSNTLLRFYWQIVPIFPDGEWADIARKSLGIKHIKHTED